nr:hypothetical protein CFP56_39311 [Quercus suber]
MAMPHNRIGEAGREGADIIDKGTDRITLHMEYAQGSKLIPSWFKALKAKPHFLDLLFLKAATLRITCQFGLSLNQTKPKPYSKAVFDFSDLS